MGYMAETADEYNSPGHCTAFIGYEWTSTPEGSNLHRVVMFKDGADKATQVVPFASFDSADPEDLWAYLSDYEARTGDGHPPQCQSLRRVIIKSLLRTQQRVIDGDWIPAATHCVVAPGFAQWVPWSGRPESFKWASNKRDSAPLRRLR